MFGRRRHVAPVVAAPAPQLTDERIFDIVHAQIAAAIGENGEWTLTRRTESDTDGIFHGVIAHSVTTHVIEALRVAREQLTATELRAAAQSSTEQLATAKSTTEQDTGDHVAYAAPEPEPVREPAAFGWQPAPITVWTDLKKPVTGPIPGILDHELVA